MRSPIGWMIITVMGCCLALVGCDADPFPGGGGGGLDDGIQEGDETLTMCDDYPDADNNFAVGSIVRNYEFYDMEDDDLQICEFSKASATLLFMAVTAES